MKKDPIVAPSSTIFFLGALGFSGKLGFDKNEIGG
jgi:hypothetical protein